MLRYCVIGAGHGGLALAGHLGVMGFPVALWARSPAALEPVRAAGGVFLEGEVEGFGPVRVAETLAEALEWADVLLVALPASAHREMARLCAPHLRDGQRVLLLPGRTAGAVEFAHVLREEGCTADVTLGEAQTFPYASRKVGPCHARIHGVKRRVLAAALPASRTGELLAAIKPALPQFMPARWVWKTSLDNVGAIFHPGVTLLNAGRVESTGGAFRHYVEGITPSVAALLERLDEERVAVARALGVGALTAREWLAEAYGVERPTLYEAIQATTAYADVAAPSHLNHRYIWEDVPTGLVPIASLGEACGVATPVTDGLIQLANGLCGVDFRETGRTLARLGMAGWGPERISQYALEGDVMGLV
ncbi:MAG: NAD/NADP octopine/nopaline dehydrogenase family protein [Symbiobacterium sp.]|uniref:NAD/NADP-dependent octopine/nopaline dehydrogenase family protein n=1 Tax=Symbiobacterium sp. TaxID=1971213 RepID=UPI003463BF4F